MRADAGTKMVVLSFGITVRTSRGARVRERVSVMVLMLALPLFLTMAMFTTSALAECAGRMAGGGFRVAQNDTTHVYVTGQRGDVCRGRLRSHGSLQIGRASVVTPARGAISYMPKVGFAGSDVFTIQVCGTSNAGSGCSTIHYHVTIN